MTDLKDFVCLTSHCKCNSKCDDCSECENEIDKWLAEHDSELLDKVAEEIKNGCTCTDYSCGVPFNRDCVNCRNNMIDYPSVMEVIAEMKAEVSK